MVAYLESEPSLQFDISQIPAHFFHDCKLGLSGSLRNPVGSPATFGVVEYRGDDGEEIVPVIGGTAVTVSVFAEDGSLVSEDRVDTLVEGEQITFPLRSDTIGHQSVRLYIGESYNEYWHYVDLDGDGLYSSYYGEVWGPVAVIYCDGASTIEWTPIEEEDPASTPGKITGGGWLDGERRVSFGLNVQYAATDLRPHGRFEYNDKSGVRFNTDQFDLFAISGNEATLRGDAIVDGQLVTFEAHLTDHGEPGSDDEVSLTLGNGYSRAGMHGGNIQLHSTP